MGSVYLQAGSVQALQDNTSSSVTNGSTATAATTFDNSNGANLFFWADFELQVTFSVAPTANTVVELYIIYAMDSTNYADSDSTTPPNNLFVGSFPVRAVTSAQRVLLRGVPLSPAPLKAFIRNSAGQTMSAGWQLRMLPYREVF